MRRLKLSFPAALILILIAALIVSILLPTLDRLRHTGGRVPCASNLRQIGAALYLYSKDHQGRYPQRLEDLVNDYGSGFREVLVCAVSGKPTIFDAPGAVAADLTAEDVVAHEPVSAHEGQGSNVLYGDGHVCWLTVAELQRDLRRTTTRAATRQSR